MPVLKILRIPSKAGRPTAIHAVVLHCPETVPMSQLLPADSIAIKLKELAHKRYLFVQMGISGTVGCFVVGVTSFFSVDIVKSARIIDIVMSVITIGAVSGVVKTATVGQSKQ